MFNGDQFFGQVEKWQKEHSGKFVVIKFGGALAENNDIVRRIAQQIDLLHKIAHVRPVVVHGGGKQINQDLKLAGIEIMRDKESGLRITDKATLAVSDRSLRSLNSDIVRIFHDACDEIVAVGSAGYDGKAIQGKASRAELGGFTGDTPEVKGDYFKRILSGSASHLTPVIYPICWNASVKAGEEGRLNINADDVATALAIGLNASRLIFVTDVPGVLTKDGRLISEMSPADAEDFIKDGTITGGMIPKVKSIIKAAKEMTAPKSGASFVSGFKPYGLVEEFLTNDGGGTFVARGIACKIVDAPSKPGNDIKDLSILAPKT